MSHVSYMKAACQSADSNGVGFFGTVSHVSYMTGSCRVHVRVHGRESVCICMCVDVCVCFVSFMSLSAKTG